MLGHRYHTSSGIYVGLTVSFLLASLAMVQIRCKLVGGYPCGDWSLHGYTWHFLPPFLFLLLTWALVSLVFRRREGLSWWEAVSAHGEAASPMLGLVIAWAWYGVTGPQFHAPTCTIPVLCHDTVRFSIVIWSAPWIAWGGWRLFRMWYKW